MDVKTARRAAHAAFNQAFRQLELPQDGYVLPLADDTSRYLVIDWEVRMLSDAGRRSAVCEFDDDSFRTGLVTGSSIYNVLTPSCEAYADDFYLVQDGSRRELSNDPRFYVRFDIADQVAEHFTTWSTLPLIPRRDPKRRRSPLDTHAIRALR
jgi:hypothetical protein